MQYGGHRYSQTLFSQKKLWLSLHSIGEDVLGTCYVLLHTQATDGTCLGDHKLAWVKAVLQSTLTIKQHRWASSNSWASVLYSLQVFARSCCYQKVLHFIMWIVLVNSPGLLTESKAKEVNKCRRKTLLMVHRVVFWVFCLGCLQWETSS